MPATKTAPAIKDILDEEFDTIIQNFNQTASIPGLALMVHQRATPSRPGETIYKSYGVAYDDQAMTPQTRMPTGFGEQFTALALLRLLHEQGLDENTPVRQVLPDFRLANETEGRAVTFCHVLSHTSGAKSVLGCWSEMIATSTPLYEYVAKLPCPDLPGAAFSYNTLLYDVCVLAIEALSGESIEAYLERTFFKPLTMDRTSFEGEGREDAAEGHIGGEAAVGVNESGSPMFTLPFGRKSGFQALPSTVAWKGTGRLITCAEDMAKWMAYLPTDPFFSKVSSPRAIASCIVRPGMSILDKDEKYSFGFFIGSYRGVPYVERWGAVAGFSGLLTHLPSLGISIVSLNNSSEGGEVGSLITGLAIAKGMGDNTESVVRSITDEMAERVHDETIDFAPVSGTDLDSSSIITGTYTGSGIGKLAFDTTSNVRIRPQCVTLPWLCWLHGDVKPIVAYLGNGKYAGCLEYRQWERDGTAEVVRYGSPFRMERLEGSEALWVSECYLSEPFMLHPHRSEFDTE